MEKSGIKAFIFSFSLSLSALVVADKILECAPQKNQDELVISNKNIVLFINENQPAHLKAQPVKKIALNVLPDIPNLPEMSGNLDIKSDTITPDETVIVADDIDNEDFSFNYIPLDIDIAPKNTSEPALASTKQAEPKSVEKETAKTLIEDEPTASKPVNKIIVVKKDNPPHEEMPEEPIERAISESKPLKPIVPEVKKTTSQPILTAKADESAPMLLIPLERGNGEDFDGTEMKIAIDDGENQIAATDKSVPIKSLGTPDNPIEATVPADNKDDPWKSMAEIKAEKGDIAVNEQAANQSAWSVAKGREFPKNNLVLEANTNKSEEEIRQVLNKKAQATATRSGEIQVAGEMIDNLLIPIPQDILEDENLTPQLTSSAENRSIERELEEDRGIVREEPQPEKEVEILDAQGKNIHKKNESILSSITSIFSGNSQDEQNYGNDDESGEGIIDSITRKLGGKKDEPKILPTEIRLSFQPNRAEISGSTLQWIQAFGNKAAKEAAIALEIRLNANGDKILQQKRLNLLSNILTGRGVNREKIHVVYTTREPNSFVMRTIWINEQNNEGLMKNNTQNNNGYYLQW